eukprot:9052988-Ditylum_brightwellii.AAC.1
MSSLSLGGSEAAAAAEEKAMDGVGCVVSKGVTSVCKPAVGSGTGVALRLGVGIGADITSFPNGIFLFFGGRTSSPTCSVGGGSGGDGGAVTDASAVCAVTARFV